MDDLAQQRQNMYQAQLVSASAKATVAASAAVLDLLDRALRALTWAKPRTLRPESDEWKEAKRLMESAWEEAVEVHRSNEQLLEEKERERLEISRPVWKRRRRESRARIHAAQDAAAGPPLPLALPAPALAAWEQVQGGAPAAQEQ